MTTSGDVNISLQDGSGSAVVVPAASVQLVMGCSSIGTAAALVATRSLSTLQSLFGYGPMVEAAALVILAGGTVLAAKTTQNAAGIVIGSNVASTAITGATVATPSVITSAGHGLATGDVVTIASVGGTTTVNGTWPVTVLSSSTFSVPTAGVGAYTTGGTAQFTGVVETSIGAGTSVATVTLDSTIGAFDDTNIQITFVAGGTRGTAGITYKISRDAGRSFGPVFQLGVATTIALTNSGVTVNLGAGTIIAGLVVRFSTQAPAWAVGGVSACLTAFQTSQYGVTGIGSIQVVGTCSAADAATIEGYLDTLATGYVFNRLAVTVRDASPPVAWGGTGETDSAWVTSILAAFSAASAKRILAAAGFYNMPSAYPTTDSGTPRYRRPLAWAQSCRQVAIPPQRHSGRVKDGSLSQIVVDPTTDPADGFNYHDERLNPGLDFLTGGAGRFCSARTRIGKPGYFIVNPLLLSPLGSDFIFWPYGAVMDVACAITHQVGQEIINEDVRLQANGTLYENDARAIEAALAGAINDRMTAVGMISSVVVVVDRSTNVQTTKTVVVTVTIAARGYVLEEDVTIGFQNPYAAAA